MNLNQIRLANNRAIRKYNLRGMRIFRKALIDQTVNPDPQIMVNAYIEFYQYVFVDSAQREYTQIRKREMSTKALDQFFLSTWREWIKQWVQINMLEVIAGVNRRTFEQIRDITAQGIADGLNPSALAKELRKLVGSKSRALAIATTEGTTANSMGTERSAEDWSTMTGTRLYKIWIHSGNPNEPRISHIQAQGKPIPKENNFVIDGDLLRYPGDKNAPLDQIIRCLCTVTYLSERLARKRYPNAFSQSQNQNVFNEAILTGDQDFIGKQRDFINQTIRDLNIEKKITVNFVKSNKNLGGDVTWVLDRTTDTYKMGDVVNINTGSSTEWTSSIIKHELRHIYQSEKLGFQIKGNFIEYKGEKVISINVYQKIMRGATKGDRKSIKRYQNLPWELDADNYAGINRLTKSIIVGEFYTVDLIELPNDILNDL